MPPARIPLRKLAAAIVALAVCPCLHGATVLYYQFEGAPAVTAGSITDASGNGNTGTAVAYGGSGATVPVYSSTTVGAVITNGLDGPVVNASNTTSLRFENPGPDAATPAYNVNAGGRVTTTSNAMLQPALFTVEAFVKVEDLIQFAAIVGKERESGSTWLLDNSPIGHAGTSEPTNMTLRARYDQQPLGGTTGSGSGFNQNVTSSASISNPDSPLGDGWYHVAMTYENDVANLFVNYAPVGSRTLSAGEAALVYNGGVFFIGGGGGGRGFDGWIDEVRFSDSILTPTQFLHVSQVPEPGRTVLLLAGGLSLLLRRRR